MQMNEYGNRPYGNVQGNPPGGISPGDIQLKPFNAVKDEQEDLPRFGSSPQPRVIQNSSSSPQQQPQKGYQHSEYESGRQSPQPRQQHYDSGHSPKNYISKPPFKNEGHSPQHNINNYNSPPISQYDSRDKMEPMRNTDMNNMSREYRSKIDTVPRVNHSYTRGGDNSDQNSEYNSTHNGKATKVVEMKRFNPQQEQRGPVSIKTIEAVNSTQNNSPQRTFKTEEQKSIYTEKQSDADAYVELDYFKKHDVVLIEKQYSQVQTCFGCKDENTYSFYTLDRNLNKSASPIFEGRETLKPCQECCCSVDCKGVEISLHGAKSIEMTISDEPILSYDKDATFVCCSMCGYEYEVNMHGESGNVNIGRIIRKGCHYLGKYEVRDDLDQLLFVIKSKYQNACMIETCNCHNMRGMKFDVRDPLKRHLTNMTHEKNALTIMFPPKLTKKQRALFLSAGLVITQTFI